MEESQAALVILGGTTKDESIKRHWLISMRLPHGLVGLSVME